MPDRSSRPRYCLHATPHVLVDQVLEQHRSRQTYRQIAQQLPVAPSTIAQLPQHVGLHQLADLEAAPVNRYEYARPGQLLHPEIKKLARFRKPGHRVTGNRQINSNGIEWYRQPRTGREAVRRRHVGQPPLRPPQPTGIRVNG
ncbi:MAG: hypothetical protein WC617_20215 [Rhodanobacter sp.]